MCSYKKDSNVPRSEEFAPTEMPFVEPYEYMVELLKDIGPDGISWTELYSWKQLHQYYLSWWESHTLVRLSRLYENSYRKYYGSNDPPPVSMSVIDKEALGKRVQDILRNSPVKGGKRR